MAITGDAPRKRAQAAHRMVVGRVRPYAPRTAHTRAIAEEARRYLDELNQKPTLRHIFYHLSTAGLIAKSEKGYELTQEQTARMRTGGWIPMDCLIDGTRHPLDWRFHARPSEALESAVWTYARDPWLSQPVRAELWLEADTHKEMLRPVAAPLRVSMVVMRGNCSLTTMYARARLIERRYRTTGQRTHIVYVGDHDPPGLDMSWKLHERLVEQHMPPEAATVERVALTFEQIKDYELPTRPTKKSDARTAWYEEMFPGLGCVELDAMRPDDLLPIVDAALRATIADRKAWAEEWRCQEEERARLQAFVEDHRTEIDGEEEDEEDDVVVLCPTCSILHAGLRCPSCGTRGEG